MIPWKRINIELRYEDVNLGFRIWNKLMEENYPKNSSFYFPDFSFNLRIRFYFTITNYLSLNGIDGWDLLTSRHLIKYLHYFEFSRETWFGPRETWVLLINLFPNFDGFNGGDTPIIAVVHGE